ncbi:MAG: SprT family zinc-dependent metalloprotease [Humidesulfovibrio sp.]|uniref:M48 family metallopeptidase n=1 Tax=Humidesulfovibrio sp. TaxID=2910988 RepID=UPI0027FE11CD|nr:SprT family zinc-dependent metalloprotease [Humidesulfovibrio sp.]MDQ7833931.1 SprT family zinc-dependent metalloprotease [Humidesulfovibrio sp.]
MLELLEITHAGQRILVQVRYDRFRTLRLSVRPEGTVLVRAPRRASQTQIRAHVETKAGWIIRHLERFRVLREAAPQPLTYLSGETHAFLGREYTLEARQDERNAVRLEDGCLVVTTLFPPTPEKVRKLLDTWHLEQARELFHRFLRALQPQFDALNVPRPACLKIRAMTSRWGTCSRSGTITLNRHLTRAPLECVEYVVAHELCHLRHFGHDAHFYGLLERVVPDWKARRRRLRSVPL